MIRVKLVRVNEDSEMVMSMEVFENAKKYNDKDIRKWVKTKAKEYSMKQGLENTEEDYYEFRYEKFSKVDVPAGAWAVCEVEFLTDKL